MHMRKNKQPTEEMCRHTLICTHSIVSLFDWATVIWLHKTETLKSDLALVVEGAESLAQGKLQAPSTFKDSGKLRELQSGSVSTDHLVMPVSANLLSQWTLLPHFPCYTTSLASLHPSLGHMKSGEKVSRQEKEWELMTFS